MSHFLRVRADSEKFPGHTVANAEMVKMSDFIIFFQLKFASEALTSYNLHRKRRVSDETRLAYFAFDQTFSIRG